VQTRRLSLASRWVALAFVFGSFAAGPAAAETQTAEQVRVVLADGQELVALLVGEDEAELFLQTDTQVLRTPRGEVVELELLGFDVPVPALIPEGGDGERWIILKLQDGSMVTGTLEAMDVESVVVHSGEDLVAVPQTQIVAMNLGTFGDAEPPAIPETARGWYRGVREEAEEELSVGHQLARLESDIAPDAMLRYAERRIELRDKRGQPIGPKELDYPARDFKEHSLHPYSAWSGGQRLRADGLFRLVDDGAVLDWWAERTADRRARTAVWMSFSITGSVMMAAAALVAGVSNDQGVSQGDYRVGGVAPVWGIGLGFAITGTGFGLRTVEGVGRDYDHDLRDLMTREAAWVLVEEHNSALRRELGLPDEEVLDAWGSPVVERVEEER
jgi:hypothetical protein